MKKFNWIIFVLLFVVCACSRKPVWKLIAAEDLMLSSEMVSKANCNDYKSYLPDTIHPEYNTPYTVNINFHVVDDSTGRNNFTYEKMLPYFWLMTDNANLRLRKNEKMNLPKGNNTPVLNPYYQYKIKPSLEIGNTTGQYHHTVADSTVAFFLNKGEGQNNYDTKIKELAMHPDSILNIFVMSYPPENMKRNAEIYHGAGIALGSVVKIAGLFQKGGPEWGYATLLNHEIGHVYGLSHAWMSDGCDDTPNHDNCFDDGSCKSGKASNNMMDYNNSQMAMTPCQIGRIRKLMGDEKAFQRKLLEPDWCAPLQKTQMHITDTVIWSGARDITGDIVIEDGAYLQMCCRVSMPRDSKIEVRAGATLVLDNVRLENSCNFLWQGIVVEQNKHKSGKVIKIGSVQIDTHSDAKL